MSRLGHNGGPALAPATLTEMQVYGRLRRLVDEIGAGEVARRAGCSPAYVSQVINAHRPPSKRILQVLRVRARVVYEIEE